MSKPERVDDRYWALLERGRDGKRWHVLVKGRPATVKGYEEYDLFIHRTCDQTEDHRWVAAEGQTGAEIAVGNTLKKTEKALRRRLTILGTLDERRADFDKRIQRLVEQVGLTPRYGGKFRRPPKGE